MTDEVVTVIEKRLLSKAAPRTEGEDTTFMWNVDDNEYAIRQGGDIIVLSIAQGNEVAQLISENLVQSKHEMAKGNINVH